MRGEWTADLEIHERGDGKWTWALIERPEIHKPPYVIWDTTAHATAREAIDAGERTIRSWIGRPVPWEL